VAILNHAKKTVQTSSGHALKIIANSLHRRSAKSGWYRLDNFPAQYAYGVINTTDPLPASRTFSDRCDTPRTIGYQRIVLRRSHEVLTAGLPPTKLDIDVRDRHLSKGNDRAIGPMLPAL
jgi:hypothetical protein